MIVTKGSSYKGENQYTDKENFVRDIDADVTSLFLLAQGRIRFGNGVDGANLENISGQWQQFTSDGVANTEFSVAHTVGAIPVGYIIVWQDKAGSLYQGPTTGTAWTSTAVYLKCSVASVTFKIALLK
jgi:hypothetical protein